jgi:hypothetical protein
MATRSGRPTLALATALLAVVALLIGGAGLRADPAPAITLSNTDNGATVTGTVGESVVLRLDTALNWTVSLDNPSMLFRPPLALVNGVQGDWEIVAPGRVTISATGDPPCRQATPACAAPSQLWSATVDVAGTLHSLTAADNGTTVAAGVGDYVRLDVAPLLTLNPQSSNPAVLAPLSVGLYNGVLLQAIAPGQATLTATINPSCYPKCQITSVYFRVLVQVALPVTPQNLTPPASDPGLRASAAVVSCAAGWNLVGVPDGATLPVDAYHWQPQSGSYATVPAGQPLQGGSGYWAYFATATSVTISGGQPGATVAAQAGAWAMVGDPSATSSATVGGADVLFVWDPISGQYTLTDQLHPGQGGLAMRATAGQITITAVP